MNVSYYHPLYNVQLSIKKHKTYEEGKLTDSQTNRTRITDKPCVRTIKEFKITIINILRVNS